jgi:hypothetical protein
LNSATTLRWCGIGDNALVHKRTTDSLPCPRRRRSPRAGRRRACTSRVLRLALVPVVVLPARTPCRAADFAPRRHPVPPSMTAASLLCPSCPSDWPRTLPSLSFHAAARLAAIGVVWVVRLHCPGDPHSIPRSVHEQPRCSCGDCLEMGRFWRATRRMDIDEYSMNAGDDCRL